MNSKTIKLYKDKVSLNRETFMFLSTILGRERIGKYLIMNNKIVLSLEVNDETKETNEWVGII